MPALALCATALYSALLAPSAGAGLPVRFDYSSVLAALHDSTGNFVDIELVDRGRLWYRAWAAWTLPHPMRSVATAALDFGSYPETFSYVYRCDRITRPQRVVSSLGTWYLEGRAGVARVWAIGDIDSLWWNADSTEMRVVASQNENKGLESVWREVLPGWMNFRTRGLRLAAFVVAHGEDSCRVGIVAETKVNKPMPQWLVKFAVQIVLPRLLRELELAIPRSTRIPAAGKKRWWPW
ncbi:MAG: hypothetical protein GF331_15060 [Chitinivibrionales bacterium]|nr:hypothetical protein [Chitinivibrionales bacterium]